MTYINMIRLDYWIWQQPGEEIFTEMREDIQYAQPYPTYVNESSERQTIINTTYVNIT